MTALRILHVVPYYEQAWAYGGIPRLATTMTRALARRGHQVTVCTTDVRDARNRAIPDIPNPHGIDVRMFPNLSNAAAYHLQFFTPLGLWRYLQEAAATFDIGHIHACHNLPGVMAARLLARAEVPYVVSPNGTARPIERRIAAKRLFAGTAGRRILADASRVVAVSRAEEAQLAALGVPSRAISRVPNPIDETDFARVPAAAAFRRAAGLNEAPVILFLGKLTPRKGVDHLIRAFAAIDRPELRLVIAGNDMGAGAAIDALVRRAGLAPRVIRTGLIEGAARLDALAAATVLVYPSRDEIFGLVPLEALLCGVPVVVCDDSGCGEVVTATGGGCLVPYGDASALAAAIEGILDDGAAWRARARAAGLVARRLFGAGVVCTQLEALYADVLMEAAMPRRRPA